jgi:5-(aminomethyl)-3-furanmethanol phosphate kinase
VTSNPVTLIKVGGSLLDWSELPRRLIQFLEQRHSQEPDFRPVLLCGGGPFAESVRRLDRTHHLGDFAAHRLAIQAMDLASTVLLCLLPGALGMDRIAALEEEMAADDIPLLVPSLTLDELESRQPSPLPPSWDVTSDTLAAWIASQLQARSLVLLKSASLPAGATRDLAARLKLVDPYFPLISSAVAQVEYLNLRDPSAAAEILR